MRTPVNLSKFVRSRAKKAGRPPGELVHVGERKAEDVTITVMDYDGDELHEEVVDSVEACFKYRDTDSVTWINIDGLHEADVIQQVGDHFDLHPLVLEDIMNTDQRPKLEDFDDHLFLVLKMLQWGDEVAAEQVSLVLGDGVLISFQESHGDVFDPVRERLRNNKGKIRRQDADYLMYALLDAIVDNYFIALEHIGDAIEEMESGLIDDPGPEQLQRMHSMKRELIFLRKSVWPLREVISKLQRSESDLIADSTGIYLRDVYDHTIQVIDIIESFRDMLSGTLDVYLSSISNRMNEVMKVLTVIATIFIPLTFIAGVYGMNFDPSASPFNMPELNWYWGYPAVLLVMAAVAGGMVYYFRRKGWL